MMKPYSEDLGTRVVAAVAAAQRVRQTGSVAAKPMGGDRNSRLKNERDWLLARVAASPDLPLHDVRRELAARHIHVGYATIWRFFAKEKITFKKNRLRRRAGPA